MSRGSFEKCGVRKSECGITHRGNGERLRRAAPPRLPLRRALFVPKCRRAPSGKAVICFCLCLYQVLSHILGVSLPPSACSNPLCRHPPPSSEGGEGAPAPRTEINCFGKEDSNERNPSGVSFVFVQVAFALQRRGEGTPVPTHRFNCSGRVCKFALPL